MSLTSSAHIYDAAFRSLMMWRPKRLRDYPQLPWVDPKICLHPVPTLLLKFNDDDETVYRCDVCGKLMTSVELASEAVR